MSAARRHQLLAYAATFGVCVIEGAQGSEFRQASRPLPTLQGLDVPA